uniref:Uncharacterized protein n=1 Tax=Panagrolaimus superbus TaxID=310955 RepID=A0A914Y2I3_9BILA
MESVNTEKEDEVKTCENNLDDLISVVEVVEQLVKDTVENKAAENQNDIESMNVVVDENDSGKSDDHEVSSSAIFVQQNEAIKDQSGLLFSEADAADDLNAKVDDSGVSAENESVKDSTDITVDHEQSKQDAEPPKEEKITTEVTLDRSDNEKVDDPEVIAEVIAIHQTESVEMQIEALSVEETIAKDQRQFEEDAEISKEEEHIETDVIADDQGCKEDIVVAEDAAKNASAEVPLVQQNATVTNEEHPSAATASTSTSSTIINNFDSIFDDFLQKYLETEPSKLDDHEIRAFTIQIPRDYVVPEDRFQTIFKVLFKIKDLQNKAVYNDSLALIEKVYSNLDYNKFLFDFWSCDQFKDRELGPIGYSFTEGRHRYDFGDVQQYDSDITLKNSKAVEAAWSMLLDVKATVNELLNDCIKERSLHSFLSIILRRFKCLGDYKIKIDGKETPIFLYFYEKAHDYAIAIGYLPVILSYLVSVTWTPKNGKHRWALMQPNYSLCKIMELILREDENQPKYLTALQRLFNPFDFKLEYFECDIEWNSESEDFDNPSIFLFNLMKYFNRKNSLEFNNDIFNIIDCFKKSLHQAKAEITNFEMIEGNSDIDWPFSYCILDKLEARNVKRYISESIFKALPPTFGDKCISMNETETSLKTALIEIMELYFLCRSARPIPDAFFKSLFYFLFYF